MPTDITESNQGKPTLLLLFLVTSLFLRKSREVGGCRTKVEQRSEIGELAGYHLAERVSDKSFILYH